MARTRSRRERGKRHSPEQIVRKLREADAMLSARKSLGEVLQQLGVSEQTYHRWRNQYGGMKAEEAKRLKQLEQENGRLKKLVAEQAFDIEILNKSRNSDHTNHWNLAIFSTCIIFGVISPIAQATIWSLTLQALKVRISANQCFHIFRVTTGRTATCS